MLLVQEQPFEYQDSGKEKRSHFLTNINNYIQGTVFKVVGLCPRGILRMGVGRKYSFILVSASEISIFVHV